MTTRGRRTSGLTRRDALKLAGAAGAAAGLGFRGGARARQATLAGERPTLRVGVAGITESLDPHLDNRNQRTSVVASVFDGLTSFDFAGQQPGFPAGIVPALATAWERRDELTLDLTLRDDVLFHDGSPMTADDVKFSLELPLSVLPETYPQAKSTLGPLAGVEVVDRRTVRIMTTAPDPILERRLTTYAGWIVPRAAFEAVGPEAFGLNPIGTGPYRVVEYRPDDALILDAHERHWGGSPPAARVEFRIIPEVAARVAALVSGEVDLIGGVPPDQIATIEAEADLEARSIPLINIRTIAFNTRHPAMGDKRLRQGLSLAIDRQLLIDSLWSGLAELPRGPQFESYGELYDAERPFPAYDPERARQLIRESGYAGEPIALWVPADYYTYGEEVTQAVVEMWRAVGVEAEVQLMTIATFYDETERKTALSGSDNNEFADPDAWWFRWGTGSTIDEFLWSTPRFNELGEQARATLDVAARKAAYRELMDIWEEEAPGTVLYVPTETYGVRRDIAWQPYAYYFLDFRAGNLSFA